MFLNIIIMYWFNIMYYIIVVTPPFENTIALFTLLVLNAGAGTVYLLRQLGTHFPTNGLFPYLADL